MADTTFEFPAPVKPHDTGESTNTGIPPEEAPAYASGGLGIVPEAMNPSYDSASDGDRVAALEARQALMDALKQAEFNPVSREPSPAQALVSPKERKAVSLLKHGVTELLRQLIWAFLRRI